jgi:hypothetical protein
MPGGNEKMLKIRLNSSLAMIIIYIVMIAQLTGCSGDDEDANIAETDISNAPILPPSESMMIDLSAFSNGESEIPAIPVLDSEAQSSSEQPMAFSDQNFANATMLIEEINGSVVSPITFPAGLFNMAREHQPTPMDDGSWLWSYSVTYDFIVVDAKLTGFKENGQNYWSMNVSVENPIMPITDFEWYTGVCTEDDTSGSWQIFDIYTSGEHNPIARVDWSMDSGMERVDLTIENVDTRNELIGDILICRSTPTASSMSFSDASDGSGWDIIWDVETGAGSVTIPDYNNSEKSCWDVNKQNVTCY